MPFIPTIIISLFVMGMVEELEGEHLRVKIGGLWCGALLYADDIVVLAESGEELQLMLDVVGTLSGAASTPGYAISVGAEWKRAAHATACHSEGIHITFIPLVVESLGG